METNTWEFDCGLSGFQRFLMFEFSCQNKIANISVVLKSNIIYANVSVFLANFILYNLTPPPPPTMSQLAFPKSAYLALYTLY